MNTQELWKLAEARVRSEPNLRPYRDILLEYKWPDMDDHLRHVATDPVSQIVKWAEEVRKDEEQQAEDQDDSDLV